jgi:transcriptional regulator with XRE-family HTH domain
MEDEGSMNATVNVGAKLTQIREARQLSTGQLAERSELPEDLILQIESGDFIPP